METGKVLTKLGVADPSAEDAHGGTAVEDEPGGGGRERLGSEPYSLGN